MGNNHEQADKSEPATPKGEVLVYQAEGGQIKVDVRLEDGLGSVILKQVRSACAWGGQK